MDELGWGPLIRRQLAVAITLLVVTAIAGVTIALAVGPAEPAPPDGQPPAGEARVAASATAPGAVRSVGTS